MKKKILLLMLTLGFLGCISAQTVHSSGPNRHSQQNPTQFNHVIENKVETVHEQGNNVSNEAERQSKLHAGETDVQVNAILGFNINQNIIVETIRFICDDYTISTDDMAVTLKRGSNILYIPEGTYDIVTTFAKLTPDHDKYEKLLFVIREQVTISQEMTMTISANEAVNHVHFQPVTIDGEPMSTDKIAMNNDYTVTVVEEGNIDDVYFHSNIFIRNFGTIDEVIGNYGQRMEGAVLGSELGDFFVNNVSDRFIFTSHQAAVKGNKVYTSYFEVEGASCDTTASNNPSDYILFEDPFYSSRYQDKDNCLGITWGNYNPIDFFFSRTSLYFADLALNWEPDEPCQLYVGASMDESSCGNIPLINAGRYVHYYEFEPEFRHVIKPVMACMPITKTDNQIVFSNNGSSSLFGEEDYAFIGFGSYLNEDPEATNDPISYYPIYPGNPLFTYSIDKKERILGDNCPICVTNATQYKYKYNNEQAFFAKYTYTYLGRYGEVRVDDIIESNNQVKVDGENLIEFDGPIELVMNSPFTGVFDVYLTHDDITVDGLEGINKTHLHYDAEADDPNPPTLQMLHFRDINDNVTDCFATSNDGVIEFCGGDFNSFSFYDENIYSGALLSYFERFPANEVVVSYSPYGEDVWDELPVNELQYYTPLTGWSYTCPLAGVTGQALKGWFDLKVKLTDAAGNWQEQVISPAFRIDDLAYSSVATITPASKSGDNAIYNLAGQRMRGDLNSLPHGIYIVGGKKVVK